MYIVPDVTQVKPTITNKSTKEMLSIKWEGSLCKVRINASSLSVMQSCQRKTFLQLIEGYTAQEGSIATTFGSAIHAALEVFYASPRSARNIPPHFVEQSALMAHGHPAPQDHFLYKAVSKFVEVGEPLKALPDTDKQSLSNGVWILQEYFKTYIDDPFEVYVDEHGPIIERFCEYVIHDTPTLHITLFGTIDAVLHNVRDNVILPTDHKTTSRVGNDFYNRLKPNHQYTGYALLAKKVLGLNGTGFLVNGIEKKARPKTARGSGPHFPRQVTTRTEEDFTEFVEVVVYEVERVLRGTKSGVWPLGNVDTCAMWNGCQFQPVCSAPLSIRQAILDNTFNKRSKEVCNP